VPKPEYPLPGEAITSAWAKQMADFAGEKWRFIAAYAVIMSNRSGGIATYSNDIELTNLPASDPKVRAAEIGIMTRDAVGTNSWVMRVVHYPQVVVAGQVWGSGITNKGGFAGNFRVNVGGANNRWIKWDTNAVANANMRNWLYCFGYWIAEN